MKMEISHFLCTYPERGKELTGDDGKEQEKT
jgi:hypothetical protein